MVKLLCLVSPRSGGATTATELAKTRCTSSGSSHQHHDEKKKSFLTLFFWFALFKNSSLLITHAQKINLLLLIRGFFSLRTSITNQHTEERNHTNFIIFPLLALVTKLLLLLLRASAARYSHTPNFFLLFSTSSSRDIQQEERKNLAMTNLFCSGRTLTHTCTHTLRVA